MKRTLGLLAVTALCASQPSHAVENPPAPNPTQTPAVAAMDGRTRTLADVARERKLGIGPKAGAFSVGASNGAATSSQSSTDAPLPEGCDTIEAKLRELNRSNLSANEYSRSKKALSDLQASCSNVVASRQAVAAAKSDLANSLRALVGTQLSPSDAALLRGSAASNNQTATVDGNGKKHTSEQLVFPGVGYVYLRDGHVETVQVH